MLLKILVGDLAIWLMEDARKHLIKYGRRIFKVLSNYCSMEKFATLIKLAANFIKDIVNMLGADP